MFHRVLLTIQAIVLLVQNANKMKEVYIPRYGGAVLPVWARLISPALSRLRGESFSLFGPMLIYKQFCVRLILMFRKKNKSESKLNKVFKKINLVLMVKYYVSTL